jgi:hypothetical protein
MALSSSPSYSQQNCPCPVRDSSNQSQSLADIARETQKNKTAHAKPAFTDEDMEVKKGPLPRLNLEDTDNSDEIIAAIAAFKAKHNEHETEQAVRTWYDEYDELLAVAVRENNQIRDQRESTSYHSYELCQQGVSYKQCQERRQTEIWQPSRPVRDAGQWHAGWPHPAVIHEDSQWNQPVQPAIRVVQDPQRQRKRQLLIGRAGALP